MKCPKCQSENRRSVKFCEDCGASMEVQCPSCNALLQMGIKYCGECGHDITLPSEPAPKELSLEEKIDKIQKYIPKGLAEKILSQRDQIEGERKHVTVMFCDMKGFTPLVEKIGADEAYAIMDQVYEILIHQVRDYDGTVNEMTGDGIMALFGAPIAIENAPQRAILTAMNIHREMARYNDRLRQEKQDIPQIKMRVGIHSGSVVVGTLGNDLRVEFKAVGDTVNLASRMENLAKPGATYITEDTFKLAEGLFRFEALGTKKIKGKKDPVKVYQVIARSNRSTRFDVSTERGLTPLVGRKRELEILLDGFEMAKSGRGQAFSIVAEAGSGKSRLLYEFRKKITNEVVTILEGKCLSYAKSIAFHPILDMAKIIFGIEEKDQENEIRNKIQNELKQLQLNESDNLPFMLGLFSFNETGVNPSIKTTDMVKERIIELLIKIALKISEKQPLVFVVEDLHWMDRNSEDLLKDLLESIPASKVMVIFTYRPEYKEKWGRKSYYNQINLNRFSNHESTSMIRNLLTMEAIDQKFEELVLEKAEGNPFYIEELVKSLIDLSFIKKEGESYRIVKNIENVDLPATIQSIIMARVDLLPEGAREILKVGSVIEREFEFGLIKHLMDFSDTDLIAQLLILKDSELLYERGIAPNTAYIFKHALTRDVIYDSILRSKRKALHEKVGNAVETLFSESIRDHYEILLEHYVKCENNEKGVKYSRLAETKAEKLGSLTDAVNHALKGLDCLENLPRTEDTQKEVFTRRTRLGLYDFQLFHYVEAKQYIEPIVDEVLSKSRDKTTARTLSILGAYELWVEEDREKAITYLEESLNIAKEVHDIPSLFFTNESLGYFYMHNCQFAEGLNHYNTALDINIAANTIWGISVAYGIISLLYNHSGNLLKGFKTSEKALKLAGDSGDLYSKSTSNAYHGYSHYVMGFFDEAIALSLKAGEYSERIGFNINSGFSYSTLAEVFREMGDYKSAKNYYEKAIYYYKKGNFKSLFNICELGLVLSRVLLGEKDFDNSVLDEFINMNNLKILEGPLKRQVAEVLINMDHSGISDAEQWILDAIKVNEQSEMMWELGKDYLIYADILRLDGNTSKAKECITRSINIFDKCGSVGYVKIAKQKYEQAAK